MLSKLQRRLSSALVHLEDRVRMAKHHGRDIESSRTQALRTIVRDQSPPWRKLSVEPISMPGMITDEEAQYYEWIGTFYQRAGAAIELGPWLGKSTKHIIRGLRRNTQWNGNKLHVFDDFIWRKSWMDQSVSDDQRPADHSSFRELFERHVEDVRSSLLVSTGKIVDYEGNEHLPRIAWNGQPIEIMYIDCGRTLQANNGWFEIFSKSFIPDVTLLVMQDWGVHRERPRQSYNQTLLFTNAHPEMKLVHELRWGNIATFLYR